MTKSLYAQFADYAATRTGPFETDDICKCPMADFGHHLYPAAYHCAAGEWTVGIYDEGSNMIALLDFNSVNFFRSFIEHCPSWAELTARLRRAAA